MWQLIIKDLHIFNFVKTITYKTLNFFTDPPPISTIPSARNVDMIESLVCPPPPTDNSINEDAISSLIVPAPGKRKHNGVDLFFQSRI